MQTRTDWRSRLEGDDSLGELPAHTRHLLELVGEDTLPGEELSHLFTDLPFLRTTALSMARAAGHEQDDLPALVDGIEPARLLSWLIPAALYHELLEQLECFSLDQYRFWQHSLTAGTLAMEIARQTGLCRPDEAFIAGLFHDFGKVALDQIFEDDYGRVMAVLRVDTRRIKQVERDILGVDHAQVGRWLGERWGLGAAVRDAIHYHSGDIRSPDVSEEARHLIAIVASADFVCWSWGLSSSTAKLPPYIEPWVGELIDVDALDADRLIDEVDALTRGVGELYRMPVKDGEAFKRSMQRANMELGHVNMLFEKARRQLEQRVVELTTLNQAIRRARQSLDVGEVTETLLHTIHEGLGFDRVYLFEVEPEEGFLVGRRMLDAHQGHQAIEALRIPLNNWGGRFSSCVEEVRPFVIKGGDYIEKEILDFLGVRELAVAPVPSRAGVIGVIGVDHAFKRTPISENALEILTILGNEAGMAIENARLFEQTQALAVTDELTGLHNRRHCNGVLEFEFGRARRYGRPLAVALIDVDFFKRINDDYGHQTGDEILRAVAAVLEEEARKVDIVARFGGEEFLAIFPETEVKKAHVYAERVRRIIEQDLDWNKANQDTRPVTVSVGVAGFERGMTTHEALVARADEALYRAKDSGRNQVCIFSAAAA